jgi:hypothetical protein
MRGDQRRVGAYAKLLANYASDDAIMAAGEAAELLFVRGLAFCATSDSDGYITESQMVRYVGAGMKDATKRAARLVESGLWERVGGGYLVRSWTKIHETSAEKGRRMKADRERKKSQNPPAESDGLQTDSARNPDGIQTEGSPDSLSLIHNTTSTQQDSARIPVADATPPDLTTAQTIVGEWIERAPKRPPQQVIGQAAKLVAAMLGEGIDPDDVRRGLAAWMTKGLHPSALPSVVNEVMNARPVLNRDDVSRARIAARLSNPLSSAL